MLGSKTYTEKSQLLLHKSARLAEIKKKQKPTNQTLQITHRAVKTDTKPNHAKTQILISNQAPRITEGF